MVSASLASVEPRVLHTNWRLPQGRAGDRAPAWGPAASAGAALPFVGRHVRSGFDSSEETSPLPLSKTLPPASLCPPYPDIHAPSEIRGHMCSFWLSYIILCNLLSFFTKGWDSVLLTTRSPSGSL